jgi:formate dehydrogenase major subunit
MTDLSRRDFLKVTGVTLVGSSLAALGFSPTPALAEVRQFKLARATETRNTCTYCSVACGILMYSLGDGAKNAQPNIFHIEGDPDHPVNRGTLCPKGAGLLDIVHSKRACSTRNTARRVPTSGSACPGMTRWIASPS